MNQSSRYSFRWVVEGGVLFDPGESASLRPLEVVSDAEV